MENDCLEMTVQEFTQRAIEQLRAFEKSWVEHQKGRDKEFWPEKLSEGDWDEQFLFFREGGKG